MENSRDAMAGLLDGSFILATSALHLITVVPACLLGLTLAKVMLNSLIHPCLRKFDIRIAGSHLNLNYQDQSQVFSGFPILSESF